MTVSLNLKISNSSEYSRTSPLEWRFRCISPMSFQQLWFRCGLFCTRYSIIIQTYAIYGQDYFTYQNTVLAQSVRKCAGDNTAAVLANLAVRQQATWILSWKT